ncbi:2-hydroxyacid dehydrogenase [Pseudooceanicola aestuarii]|uniref:2-hydroxyacid dehydrogenase n=1 Tax=Pseudooceanicola aestuarii TaxID=2697319 RepID=UPI0013D7DB74|nr:glyoxylate/hydroxypyruvate reductase A [Pseudooceanicola aestuarii]
MPNILFAAGPRMWETYRSPLKTALDAAGIAHDLRTDFAPDQVDYIVYAPSSTLQDFRPYTRTKAVLNLWAGVEGIVGNDTLTQPLARMVDHGLRQGMTEWVTGQVLRHHLDIDYFLARQSGDWAPKVPPLAQDRPVALLGLGELGQACAGALGAIGFPLRGWSRNPKSLPGIETFHGPRGLTECLSQAATVVLLLPLTPSTENLLNATTLAALPAGAVIVNPGRGGLIDDAALLAALDAGRITHATLDVFRQEPLPADHPYWANPRVTVTPHIASETRPDTASQVIAENIVRAEAGQPLLHRVDREQGY